jgi:hypothetical protein
MTLVFPDAATFRLALTSGVVPPEVAASPAAVGPDADRVVVETDAKLSKRAADELKRLGVTTARKSPADLQAVTCWPQAVPVERAAEPSPGATVLFELPADEFAAFAAEMLRLGNDRQSFRWVEGDAGPRVLLKVVGPPHYTLLRALDRPAGSAVRAYAEQAPRVWVELGYAHPLASRVTVAEGQLLLVGAPRDWQFAADAPFRDVYDATQFALPAAPAAWRPSPIESKFTVPLKLAAGNATDVPELWVLRGPAADGLDRFVRDADDRTLSRLRFAVGTDPAGGRVVVLRTATAKTAPPVLALDGAVGYKPYWKLPNLYVPAGFRLHPPLRRDVVRKLLADDADRLVWLAPGPAGAFTPETLSEDSFRPLADWVEYVVETDQVPLAAWVEGSRFAFDHFVCNDTAPPKPREDKKPQPARPSAPAKGAAAPPPAAAPAPVTPDAGPVVEAVPELPAVKPPSEWAVRRQELEDQFLGLDGPLDSPDRQALWPELAAANAGAGDLAEAAVAWANALWDKPAPPAGWLDAWVRAELPDLPRSVPAAEFDKRLAAADPTPGEARQFAAVLLSAAHQATPPAWFGERLPKVQRHLEAHEAKLPVRLAWLAAYRLAQLGGADVLGLARVRDRLLQRLLEDGLNPERNLPHFLRFAGSKDSARARVVKEKSAELHRLVRTWAAAGLKSPTPLAASDGGATLAYVDLLFAFGAAKLGDPDGAKALTETARRALTTDAGTGFDADTRRVAGPLLLRIFGHRIEQGLADKPHAGRLAPDILDRLDALRREPAGNKSPGRNALYAINRLRDRSRVVEPQERFDAIEDWGSDLGGPLQKALADLRAVHDPQPLTRTVRHLYKTWAADKSVPLARLQVLLAALPLAGRAGEAFAVELIGLVPDALAAVDPAAGDPTPKQGRLFEAALVLAAHFDRRELVGQLADRFVGFVAGKPDDARYDLVSAVAGPCLRGLRKLGQQDETDRLLQRLQDEVLKGQSLAQFKAKSRPDTWGKALRSLLPVAGGWLAGGAADRAAPVLADARAELLGPGGAKMLPKEYAALAQAYVAAVGHGPAEAGLEAIASMFREMPAGKVVNGFTTAPVYSLLHLTVAEAVVLALTNDDFALGSAGRRWLDEDETLIRRRVHRDVKDALARGGL